MSDYQVIARKFRPQSFKEVLGQEAIVTTLKNAIKFNRLAQAYLFCGSRGTGKTTLARLFAKAINCQQLTVDGEPCNQCSSCREITSGCSLDVLEIDGASHRGVEDIRQINETVGYAAASGGYKIYLIDEAHMLTKEAFNALLKTLEEPPPKVKFFFATTEPHKMLPTILSRCQRFNLNRISIDRIVSKLRFVSQRLSVEIEEEALLLLAQQAEGGLRDAESLLDQIISFQEGKIDVEAVNAILGLMPKASYFELDQAGKKGDFNKAFELAHRLFSEGKNLIHFVEGLTEHFRTILLVKLAGKDAPFLSLSISEKERYETTALLYSQEQCLNLIDYLIEAQNKIRFASSERIALEAILLFIMRSHFRLPIEALVRRLSELEQAIALANSSQQPISTPIPVSVPLKAVELSSPETPSPASTSALPIQTNQPKIEPERPPANPLPAASLFGSSLSEDPTPSFADLGMKKSAALTKTEAIKTTSPTLHVSPSNTGSSTSERKNPAYHYDTLLQFAAIELEGKIQRNK